MTSERKRPSPAEQRKLVEDLEREKESSIKEGDRYYVVATLWWQFWVKFTEEQNAPDPMEVDNSEIVTEEEDGEHILKESGLEEGKDYFLKHESIWKLLYEWYGATDQVFGVAVKDEKGQVYVDLYPIRFHIYVADMSSGKPTESGIPVLVVPRSEFIENVPRILDNHLSKANFVPLPAGERRYWVCEGSSTDFNLVREEIMGERIRDVLTGLGTWKLLVEIRTSSADKWPRADTSADGEAQDSSQITASLRRRAVSFIRESPQIGQRIDAKRKVDGRWLEAIVTDVSENPATNNTQVTVHFLSFEEFEDEQFDANDEDNLQPPYTRVPDWRTQLRKDEEVEVHRRTLARATTPTSHTYSTYSKYDSNTSKGTWLIGKAVKFNRGTMRSLSEEEIDMEVDGSGASQAASPKRKKTSACPLPGRGSVLVEVRTGTYMSQRKEVWIDLDSEDIAHRYTHLAKPKTTYGAQGLQQKPVQSGVVGLRNLGNTCFMNSMLQCLSFTVPITDYFLRGEYENDLNRKNPLGTGGKLAEAYAALVHDVWSDNFSVVSPVDFKQQLGRAFTQFQGYQQQDSHELFSLLVDGLHEDLNRIKKKPYTESVEANGRSDDVVARESWEVFKKRNDSVIVDTMMGLLRSHLTCPKCRTEAVKFDPYSNWSVPIPKSNLLEFNIVLVPLSSGEYQPPRRIRLRGPRSSPSKFAATSLSEKTGIPVDDLYIVKVDFLSHYLKTIHNPLEKSTYRYPTKLEKEFEDDSELVAFELSNTSAMSDESDRSLRYILEVRFQTKSHSLSLRGARVHDFLVVSKKTSHKELYSLVWSRIHHMFDSSKIPASFLARVGDGTRMDTDGVVSEEAPFQIFKDSRTALEINDSDLGQHFHVVVKLTDCGVSAMTEAFLENWTKERLLASSKFQTFEERDALLGLGSIELDPELLSSPSKATGFDIYSCFDKFREREQLGESDEWFCPKCKDLVQAYKQMDLWTAPEILVVHLKRFYYERNSVVRTMVDREKIGDLVHFPLEGLSLKDYVRGWEEGDSEPIYDLYAVSNHIGGLGGGHYTAYVCHPESSKWFLMDDSGTSAASKGQVVSSQAYVLFYKRRETPKP